MFLLLCLSVTCLCWLFSLTCSCGCLSLPISLSLFSFFFLSLSLSLSLSFCLSLSLSIALFLFLFLSLFDCQIRICVLFVWFVHVLLCCLCRCVCVFNRITDTAAESHVFLLLFYLPFLEWFSWCFVVWCLRFISLWKLLVENGVWRNKSLNNLCLPRVNTRAWACLAFEARVSVQTLSQGCASVDFDYEDWISKLIARPPQTW